VDLNSLTAKCHFTRSMPVGALAMTLSLVPSWSAFGATPSSPPQTVRSFLALATRGISGAFSESYQVTQGSLSRTVDLVQKGPPGQLPLTNGSVPSSVHWSFVYRTEAGHSMQWIERGSRAWDCVRNNGAARWTCSGPGQFQPSNGFVFSTISYIPGVVLSDISEVTNGLETHQALGTRFSTSTSPRFGPVQCMEGLGTTSCLDHAGVLVSQQGGPYWTTVTLLRRSASVPASAFTLKGKSTSSGRNFKLFS
jgi:hypothetical protein